TQLAVGLTSDRLSSTITAIRVLETDARDDRDASVKASAQALLYSANHEMGAEKAAEPALSNFEELAKTLKTSSTSPDGSYSIRLERLQRQRTRPLSKAENLDLAVSAFNLGE